MALCSTARVRAAIADIAVINGEVRFVDVAAHSLNDEIAPGTLNSMIRQSGLSKRLFRK